MENLTQRAISEMSRGKKDFQPRLQIIHIQPMTKRGSAVERFIIILSDGNHHMEGVCTNNLGLAIKTGRIQNYAIIRLDEFMVNTAKNGKKVIVALKGELVNGAVGAEIGSSVSYSEQSGGYSAPVSAPKRPPSASPVQPKKMRPNDREMPLSAAEMESFVVPLQSLNPYRVKWVVKARCTAKSAIRTWQKPTGAGKVMSVDLLDEAGTEIRATMFNEAVDRFGQVFAENEVYLIAKGRVKLANKKFTHIKNDYEITLDTDAHVELVRDDQKIRRENFSFSDIKALENADENTFVDVLAVVTRVDPIASILSTKQNKYIDKRNIEITDHSAKIDLTLWSESATKYNEESLGNQPIVAVKAARVSHFGGRTLSLGGSSKIAINPDLQEVYRLKNWWDSEGKNASISSLSGGANQGGAAITDNDPRIDLCEIREKQLGLNQTGTPDLAVTKATIMSIRHDFAKPPFYFACTKQREGRQCNKKASQVSNTAAGDEFWCEACNSATEAQPRYILNFSLNDQSGSQFVNCFNDIGEQLLGISAADLAKLCYGHLANEGKFSKVFLEAAFQTKLFKLRAKSENYLDEERVRCTVTALKDIDYVAESVKLLEKLNLLC